MRIAIITSILFCLMLAGCQTTPSPTATSASPPSLPANAEAETPDPTEPQAGVDLAELRKRRYFHYAIRNRFKDTD